MAICRCYFSTWAELLPIWSESWVLGCRSTSFIGARVEEEQELIPSTDFLALTDGSFLQLTEISVCWPVYLYLFYVYLPDYLTYLPTLDLFRSCCL